jgi:hypothetical protein
MSDFDDAIGDMTDILLDEAGGAFVYHRGAESASITLRRSGQMPYQVDNGNGQIVEVRTVDFIAKTTSLPYAVPLRGDKITGGGLTYEVNPPPGGDKVFRQISPQMTRLHTKQVG